MTIMMIESPEIETSTRSRKGNRVLFAITSSASRAVLHKAAHLARALGVELELFYPAFDPDIVHPARGSSRSVDEGIREYVHQRERQLWSLAEEVREPGLKVHTYVEWDTRPDIAIIRAVLRRRPALLVVESFRKSRTETLLFDQTVHKLIETCPCPLLLTRIAHAYPSHPRVLAAVDPMHAHAKPAALDDAILTTANEVANALGGELHLFHARVPWANASHQARVLRWVPDIEKSESQVAYEHLVSQRVTRLAHNHNVPNLQTHLIDGDVIDCLPSFLCTEGVDIVAMGALSRSILQGILIGDTASRLLYELDCDVLVVKPPARVSQHAKPAGPGAVG